MIAYLIKITDAFGAAVRAARAVMDDRTPVLVEDVIAAEGCSCSTPRVAIIHNGGSYCGDGQQVLIGESLGFDEPTVVGVLGILAHEADRRDGVRRGPR